MIDLYQRLREAGFSEPQADVLTSAFEALEGRMAALEARLDRLEMRVTVLLAIQILTLAVDLAPHMMVLSKVFP